MFKQSFLVLLGMATVLLMFSLPTYAQDTDWKLLSTSGPSLRHAAAMAYDKVMDRIILFGGRDVGGSFKDDTWSWNGSSWTKLDVPGPDKRANHVMAYDSARSVIVLYGGMDDSPGIPWADKFLADTWEWDGYGWTDVTPTSQGLTGRSEAAMTYDSKRGLVLLYGGMDPYSRKGDFWAWDGANWTQLPGGAGTRQHAEMAYDSVRDRVVIAGGYYTSSTMEWDGSTWYSVSSVPGRTDPSLAYHEQLGKTVFFGGQTVVAQVYHNDTYEWDGSAWQQIFPANKPERRTMAATTYDSRRGLMVIFGGRYYDGQGHIHGDTWGYGYVCSFGPGDSCTFIRSTGKPFVESKTWESCGGYGTMIIYNGGIQNDEAMVSAAEIRLNGELVVGPDDFNQTVVTLSVPVTLLEGENILDVELRGKPGGTITIEFIQD